MDDHEKIQACQEQAVKQFLRDYLGKEKDEQTLNSILQNIGENYDADRAYVFEMDKDRKVFNNTFEWCRPGVTAEIDNLQNISIEGLDCWFKAFEEQGGVLHLLIVGGLSPRLKDLRYSGAPGDRKPHGGSYSGER